MQKIGLGYSFFIIFCIFFAALSGCSSDEVQNPTTKNNPNVKTYDSIWVEEDSALAGFSGINLLDGVNTNTNYFLRDASITSRGGDTDYVDFYLRSGVLDNLPDPGYSSRWFRAYSDLSKESFDTISYLDVGASLDSLDFTQETTEFWGYFNAPLTSHPVFCFWLNGKKYANLTNGKNVYGIIQPIESEDLYPVSPYGFRMTFRVRININGENDFRKVIPAG